MPLIEIQNLSKHFKVLNRREGLKGAFLDLFKGDYPVDPFQAICCSDRSVMLNQEIEYRKPFCQVFLSTSIGRMELASLPGNTAQDSSSSCT